MKTITVFAASRADLEPGKKGYDISLADPDKGRPYDERPLGSGYAHAIAVRVPDDWTVSESNDGVAYLWRRETALQLHWHTDKGTVTAWPAYSTLDEAKARDEVTYLRAQKLSEVA